MDFNLTNEEKEEAIKRAIDALKRSYYNDILMHGHNPQTFSLEDLGDNAEFTYVSLFKTKEKIDNLQNLLESL